MGTTVRQFGRVAKPTMISADHCRVDDTTQPDQLSIRGEVRPGGPKSLNAA